MENILEVLESGNNEEKIGILETLDCIDNPNILEKIISKLDDENIQVRGEAFSSLVLNKKKISHVLIKSLNSASNNIRGFTSLVLANRNETVAIPAIRKLVKDDNSMVRSCAIGALRYLKDDDEEIFLESLLDSNLEVRKGAIQAIIDLKIIVPDNKIKEIVKEQDSEMKRLLSKIRKQ